MSADVDDDPFIDAPEATVRPDAVGEVVAAEMDRGRTAETPTQIPARGWRDVLARVKAEVKADHATLLSAGVAFYALLALVPALVAIISIYGLVANPDDVRRQILDVLSAAPREVRDLVSTQLTSIASSSGASTIVAVVAGIVAALWSASAGIGHLIDALNVAYDEREQRGFVRLKAVAVLFTLAAIVFVVIAFAVIALLPPLIASTGIGLAGRVVIGILRWVVLLGGMMAGLSVLYRYGPDRDSPQWRWASPGAAVAAVVWLLGSLAFSVYTANFAKYNETYGSLGAVVVLMLWLYLTSLCVVVGAELNAELERQTAADTTEGSPKPLGTRHAFAADTLGAAAGRGGREDAAGPHPAGVVDRAAGVVHGQGPSVGDRVDVPFRISGPVGFAARLFGVRADRAHATLVDDQLTVRYGRWVLTTPVANIADVVVTGPYRAWKVAGPPHLSFADGGLTFATNAERGVCVSFHEPVAGLLPYGLMRHPSLTFTAAEPDLVARLLERAAPR